MDIPAEIRWSYPVGSTEDNTSDDPSWAGLSPL